MAEEAPAKVRTSISSLYLRILTAFDQLSSCLETASSEVAEQLSKEALNDQLEYFRLWVGNNGAHR